LIHFNLIISWLIKVLLSVVGFFKNSRVLRISIKVLNMLFSIVCSILISLIYMLLLDFRFGALHDTY